LDHIQEMGVQLESLEIAASLMEIFETDWAIAGGSPRSTRIKKGTTPGNIPALEARSVELVASPKGWLPREESWELPRIIGLIDGAKRSIHVQVLKYKIVNRDGKRFTDLDDALRRAAQRGVKVRLLVSEWAVSEQAVKDKSLETLTDLASVVDVRVLKIPAWSGGEIPFARVAHAKYLVVDGQVAWVGSSNWEGDYFLKSRNVGIILSGGRIPERLDKFFDENWTSTYVAPLPNVTSERKVNVAP
jgi:phosphatidylserine/phosphatidylglycerophosphate/cardiolipin synthase-like enzyme